MLKARGQKKGNSTTEVSCCGGLFSCPQPPCCLNFPWPTFGPLNRLLFVMTPPPYPTPPPIPHPMSSAPRPFLNYTVRILCSMHMELNWHFSLQNGVLKNKNIYFRSFNTNISNIKCDVAYCTRNMGPIYILSSRACCKQDGICHMWLNIVSCGETAK